MSVPRTQVGTLAWAERTGGRLSFPERLAEARAAVVAQTVALAPRVRAVLGRGPAAEAAVFTLADPPDSALCREALDTAREVYSPPLLGHALRCWLWADLFGRAGGIAFDAEELHCACLLHDVGLTERHRPQPEEGCFAVSGGLTARALLAEWGAAEAIADRVAEAIALHFNARVGLEHGAEAHLLHEAAFLDVVGRRMHELPRAARAAVLARHPRDGFSAAFNAAMGREHRERPASRAALSRRLGSSLLVRANPLDRET